VRLPGLTCNDRSIYSIVSKAIEVLYDHNIDMSYPNIDTIVVRRLELQLDLERWRMSSERTWRILTGPELRGKPKNSLEALRFEILLSIHYYRTLMLINRPLITSILKCWITDSEPVPETMVETVLPVLQIDFTAAKQLATIVQAVVASGGGFLHRYGAWFLANYSGVKQLSWPDRSSTMILTLIYSFHCKYTPLWSSSGLCKTSYSTIRFQYQSC